MFLCLSLQKAENHLSEIISNYVGVCVTVNASSDYLLYEVYCAVVC